VLSYSLYVYIHRPYFVPGH